MQQNYVLILAALACAINAIPLNINLGAYSPALVVGDGEISFGGKQDVSNLMSALQGAAGTAGAAAAAPAAAQAQPAAAQPAAVQPAAEAAVIQAPPVDETTQITALQGMGKEIAPRVVPLRRGRKSKKSLQRARDLATFNAALKYATDALVNGPEIQMGTEAAGVGILQKAGKNSAQAKAAIIAREESALPVLPKTRTTVTTMFVKVPAGAEAAAKPATATPAKAARSVEEKREPGAIDGVNLNMAAGQVAELTFVETRSVEDDEEEEAEDEEEE